MLDPRTRTLAILAVALALLTLLSLAGTVGPERVLAAPHRELTLRPEDVEGQLDQWLIDLSRSPRGLLDVDAAPAYERVLAHLEQGSGDASHELPDLRTDPNWEKDRAAIQHGSRFLPFATSMDVLVADPWLDRAALLGHRLEQAHKAHRPDRILAWSLVSLHLAADLRRLGALQFLDAAWRLEQSTERVLTTHAHSLWRAGKEWDRLLDAMGRVRFQGANHEQVAQAESLVAMASFLGVIGVAPFEDARRRWNLVHDPPGDRPVHRGVEILQGYHAQILRLLQDPGDARQRWMYAQWTSELARGCAEACLVVASPDQFREWNTSAERLLALELSLRLTAETLREGQPPESAAPALEALQRADPDFPRNLDPPRLEWNAERGLILVHWSPTARAMLRMAARKARRP